MSTILNKRLAVSLFYFYQIWILLHLVTKLLRMDAVLSYSDMAFSDFLVNYQGGFVRRGLLGEVLYQVYQVVPFDVGHAALALVIISAVACLTLLYRICRGFSYSPVLLLSGFTLQFMALAEVIGIRRDYLSLLLTFFAFWSYRHWLSRTTYRWLRMLLCQTVLLLAVLFHEGVTFYMVPILGMHFLFWQLKRKQQKWVRSLFRSMLFLLPVCSLILFVFLNKGSQDVAEHIWVSWQPLFEAFPRQGVHSPDIEGTSVQCLSCTTMDFVTGCSRHNWGFLYWGWFPMLPFTVLLFPSVLYLVSFANASQIPFHYSIASSHSTQLTTILLVQLIFMSPFFLCLSCDYGRLFCYWIISSIFAWWVFREDADCFPSIVHRWSILFHGWVSRHPFFLTPLGYVLVLVLTSCNMVGGAALGAVPFYRMLHEFVPLLMGLFHGA